MCQEVGQFKANATGATFGSITIRSFDSVIIPLPPLEVQQQIIDAMEEFEKNKNQFLNDGISIKEFEKLIKEKRNEVLKSYLEILAELQKLVAEIEAIEAQIAANQQDINEAAAQKQAIMKKYL